MVCLGVPVTDLTNTDEAVLKRMNICCDLKYMGDSSLSGFSSIPQYQTYVIWHILKVTISHVIQNLIHCYNLVFLHTFQKFAIFVKLHGFYGSIEKG